jgi:glucose-6-phosphate isomerase
MPTTTRWERFCRGWYAHPDLGITLDVSKMGLPDDLFAKSAVRMQAAFAAMDRLEAGDIANADEGRMVGHYWLRAPQRAPAGLVPKIQDGIADVEAFAKEILSGGEFDELLLVGIGGSMLGPQFLDEALEATAAPRRLRLHFIDNTDPDGIARTLRRLNGRLKRTLVVVTSKSGGTPETRNGMLEVAAAFEGAGVEFAPNAVAVTELFDKPAEFKALQKRATEEGWRKLFPMFDWVGGRTSVCSAVGLVPLALCGIDIRAFLSGAGRMDEATRRHSIAENPAALLALSWLHVGNGHGERAMVVLPYSDRLSLFSKYLQQLVMESLGKELDRKGKEVRQGLTVFGNKGSTDQHSYIQQLRDGPDNYFATFIEVLERIGVEGRRIEVAPNVASDDYLQAFLLGTREALAASNHPSMTVTLQRVDPASVGALIALFERAVGLYAELIDVNAYHQPGVEAGKKAADTVLEVQRNALKHLREQGSGRLSAAEIAAAVGNVDNSEIVFLVLRRLAANRLHHVQAEHLEHPAETRFFIGGSEP